MVLRATLNYTNEFDDMKEDNEEFVLLLDDSKLGARHREDNIEVELITTTF